MYCFLLGVGAAALHTLTLWWTVTTLRPVRTWRVLLLVWCGTLLRIPLVAAILVAAASHSLQMVLLGITGFVLARLALTSLICQRLAKPQQILPS
jgi:hypothetical protein